MSSITDIVDTLDGAARTEKLLPIVYDELRRLAAAQMMNEGAEHTLQATALVHEAYLRIVGSPRYEWQNRGHFFAAAAQAMRRILIDHARNRNTLRRGGKCQHIPLMEVSAVETPQFEELIELDDALSRLAETRPDAAELVQLRVFAGLSTPEAAQSLGISERTARRTWIYARAWLRRTMQAGRDGTKGDRDSSF